MKTKIEVSGTIRGRFYFMHQLTRTLRSGFRLFIAVSGLWHTEMLAHLNQMLRTKTLNEKYKPFEIPNGLTKFEDD